MTSQMRCYGGPLNKPIVTAPSSSSSSSSDSLMKPLDVSRIEREAEESLKKQRARGFIKKTPLLKKLGATVLTSPSFMNKDSATPNSKHHTSSNNNNNTTSTTSGSILHPNDCTLEMSWDDELCRPIYRRIAPKVDNTPNVKKAFGGNVDSDFSDEEEGGGGGGGDDEVEEEEDDEGKGEFWRKTDISESDSEQDLSTYSRTPSTIVVSSIYRNLYPTSTTNRGMNKESKSSSSSISSSSISSSSISSSISSSSSLLAWASVTPSSSSSLSTTTTSTTTNKINLSLPPPPVQKPKTYAGSSKMSSRYVGLDTSGFIGGGMASSSGTGIPKVQKVRSVADFFATLEKKGGGGNDDTSSTTSTSKTTTNTANTTSTKSVTTTNNNNKKETTMGGSRMSNKDKTAGITKADLIAVSLISKRKVYGKVVTEEEEEELEDEEEEEKEVLKKGLKKDESKKQDSIPLTTLNETSSNYNRRISTEKPITNNSNEKNGTYNLDYNIYGLASPSPTRKGVGNGLLRNVFDEFENNSRRKSDGKKETKEGTNSSSSKAEAVMTTTSVPAVGPVGPVGIDVKRRRVTIDGKEGTKTKTDNNSDDESDDSESPNKKKKMAKKENPVKKSSEVNSTSKKTAAVSKPISLKQKAAANELLELERQKAYFKELDESPAFELTIEKEQNEGMLNHQSYNKNNTNNNNYVDADKHFRSTHVFGGGSLGVNGNKSASVLGKVVRKKEDNSRSEDANLSAAYAKYVDAFNAKSGSSEGDGNDIKPVDLKSFKEGRGTYFMDNSTGGIEGIIS